jgi:hypothetical protein
VRPPASIATAIIWLVSIVGLVGQPRAARAETTPPAERPLVGSMAFTAGATCLEQGRLEAQVQTWLGRDRIRADVHLDVRGDERDPRAVRFRISRAGKSHERTFTRLPDSCDDATAVLGLAVALAIDANALAGVFAPAPQPEPPRRMVALEAAAGVEVLVGPSVGAAVGLEYGLLDWLSARLDVGTQFSWNGTVPGTAGVFDAALAATAPQVCTGGDVTDRVRIELCSGAGFGVVHAQGRGYATSRSATGPWIVAQGGLRLVVKADLSWVLDVDGVFPLHVPEFRAESGQGDPQYRPVSPAGAWLGVGPVFFF